MKKSELKQLIREVVQEVYSQQDEGLVDKIGDFLTDPTGRKRKAADAESGKEEESKNVRLKQLKNAVQHNLKSIPKYVEAFTAKAREVYRDVQSAKDGGYTRFGPQHAQGNDYFSNHAGADYEYWEKRKPEDTETTQRSHDAWRDNVASLQKKYEDIKHFIDYIPGGFKDAMKELDLKTYYSAKNSILFLGEDINEKIDRIDKFCRDYNIYMSQDRFTKIKDI
jgi:hypothetical protein